MVRWVVRYGDHGDCALAAISLACGITYEVALTAALGVTDAPYAGMFWRDIRRTVIKLGFKVKTIPFKQLDFTDEELTGILQLSKTGDAEDHVVYLWRGRIIEPKADRQELWDDPEMFFSHYGYRVARLLQVVRHE